MMMMNNDSVFNNTIYPQMLPAQVTTLVSKIQQIGFQSKHSKCTFTYVSYLTESVSYF